MGDVPGVYPVSLDGRPYNISLAPDDGGFISASVPVLRTQADQGARPGEQSLSPEDLWRRSVESWHHGAGQSHADREESDQYRFHESVHADPWTRFSIDALHTLGFTPDAVGGFNVVVAGDNLYHAKPNELSYTDTMPANGVLALTPIAGLAVDNIISITTDGVVVYVLHDTGDIETVTDTTPALLTNVANAALVRYCKDRLLALCINGDVVDVFDTNAVVFTQRLGLGFVWTDATGGRDFIYMCGYSGSGSEAHGLIYRTAVKEDGTSLDAPVIAARLPDGEKALSICGYLGLVFVGTDKGVRVCLEQSSGALEVGALIETGECRAFEPQGMQVWFGWSIDPISDPDFNGYQGLGRIDLSDYNPNTDKAPPYASDLVAGNLSTTLSIATFKDRRVFANGTSQLAAETTTQHVSFLVSSGSFGFGLTQPKTFHYIDVVSTEAGESLAIIYVNDGLNAAASSSKALSRINMSVSDVNPNGLPSFNAGIYEVAGWRADNLEYMVRSYQTINRITLYARPAVTSRSEKIQVTLLLPDYDDADGGDKPRNPRTEQQHIRSLVRRGSPVEWNDGSELIQVIVEDYAHVRTARSEIVAGGWEAGSRVTMKRFETVTPVFRAAAIGTADNVDLLSVAAPTGMQTGDRLFACVAWIGVGEPNPTVPGWSLLASIQDTGFRSAIYERSVPGSIGALDAQFVANVFAVGVVAAYTQGVDISYAATPFPSTFHDAAAGLDINDFGIEVVGQDLFAMLTATINLCDSTTVLAFVGPFRGRNRATIANGGDTLIVEIGDAVSTSTWMTSQGGLDPTQTADACTVPVRHAGELRVWAAQLDQ